MNSERNPPSTGWTCASRRPGGRQRQHRRLPRPAERLQPPEPGRPDPQLQLHPVEGHPRPAGHPQHRHPGRDLRPAATGTNLDHNEHQEGSDDHGYHQTIRDVASLLLSRGRWLCARAGSGVAGGKDPRGRRAGRGGGCSERSSPPPVKRPPSTWLITGPNARPDRSAGPSCCARAAAGRPPRLRGEPLTVFQGPDPPQHPGADPRPEYAGCRAPRAGAVRPHLHGQRAAGGSRRWPALACTDKNGGVDGTTAAVSIRLELERLEQPQPRRWAEVCLSFQGQLWSGLGGSPGAEPPAPTFPR